MQHWFEHRGNCHCCHIAAVPVDAAAARAAAVAVVAAVAASAVADAVAAIVPAIAALGAAANATAIIAVIALVAVAVVAAAAVTTVVCVVVDSAAGATGAFEIDQHEAGVVDQPAACHFGMAPWLPHLRHWWELNIPVQDAACKKTKNEGSRQQGKAKTTNKKFRNHNKPRSIHSGS